jgi:hypothetical protein
MGIEFGQIGMARKAGIGRRQHHEREHGYGDLSSAAAAARSLIVSHPAVCAHWAQLFSYGWKRHMVSYGFLTCGLWNRRWNAF